ncbi:MAG: prolipoprotein diacylglyceryl transferase, partial [Desulfobulbaceae bacterium]|nr:prolipoprotein diacylglyceryl transferase [Desulfobulbaceae bacterium]
HYQLDFWQTADLYVAAGPIGLGLGRIGNFINGELFGRVSDVPWAMVFPGGGPFPRHPSQLYECLLEGVLLFVILWRLKEKRMPSGFMLASFLVCYGLLRTFVELFREPDPQLGFLFASLTMGQLLSAVMIVSGGLIFVFRRRGLITR